MASLLYGAGLGLMECIQLRVKDIDFSYMQVTVRDGKDEKDRRTILPSSSVEPLGRQLTAVRAIHEKDLGRGHGKVYRSCPTVRTLLVRGADDVKVAQR